MTWKKTVRLTVLLATACAVAAAVRLFLVTVICIPSDGGRPVFEAGDRVTVCRMAYGVRLWPMSRWGGRRVGEKRVARGEWVAFNDPSDGTGGALPPDRREMLIGCCLAVPGDSLWTDSLGTVYLSRPAGRRCRVAELPRKDAWVAVTPDNMHWYGRMLRLHEGLDAEVVAGRLRVDGRPVKSCRFRHDYYWMGAVEGQSLEGSGSFGFVPDDYVIGRLTHIVYSLDASLPWYARLRAGRLWKRVETVNLKP